MAAVRPPRGFFSVGQGPLVKFLMMPVVSVALANAVPDVSFNALVHWWKDFSDKVASGPPWNALVGEAIEWAKTCAAKRPSPTPHGAKPVLAIGDKAPASGAVLEESPPPPAAASATVADSSRWEDAQVPASVDGDGLGTVAEEEGDDIILSSAQPGEENVRNLD